MNDDKITRFWDDFIIKSKGYHIKDSTVRWYVVHAERYIKAHSTERLSEHTPQHVEKYLHDVAQKPHLKDWQYRQIVKALQVLFVELVKPTWASDFAWHVPIDAAIEVPSEHATMARNSRQAGKIEHAQGNDGNGDRNTSGLLEKVRTLFPVHFDRLMTEIRVRQYSIRTEHAYRGWLARYIKFHDMCDPACLQEESIVRYLEHLVITRNVAGSTQSQALNALVFFYKHVLKKELKDFGGFRHSKKPRRLPVVLTREQVSRLLAHIEHPTHCLMASLL